MLDRLKDTDTGSLDLSFSAVRSRVIHIVALLLDLPIRSESDVSVVLRDLLGRNR
jgi:hypothetical protein